ncbi:hypothetical protein [Pseudonocardia sp. NPDC049154]|uniref:hypothetical protein n=1 Tax=Pseudonocardia sp. NPDC049154 TaxID=3155501 RepID=UPI0033F3CA93
MRRALRRALAADTRRFTPARRSAAAGYAGDVTVRHPYGRFEFRGRGMHIRRSGENASI